MLRPVEAGLCSWRDTQDGTVCIEHLADMHDYLDAKAVNQKRFSRWQQEQEKANRRR